MKKEEREAVKSAMVDFIDEWDNDPLPLAKSGKNKGLPTWDKVKTSFSEHVFLQKTTDNDYLLKVVGEGYRGINISDISVLKSLAKAFQGDNLERMIIALEVFGSKESTAKPKGRAPI